MYEIGDKVVILSPSVYQGRFATIDWIRENSYLVTVNSKAGDVPGIPVNKNLVRSLTYEEKNSHAFQLIYGSENNKRY